MNSRCKAIYFVLLLCSQLAISPNIHAEQTSPRIAREHIVFSTAYGDLVFALYPDVAPEHVKQLLNLTRLGVFDYSQVIRVIPGFIVQFSDSFRRARPMTKEQSDAVHKIKAEFSTEIRHTKGRLTMARYDDDPDSATTSFSILLGSAPHLDGKYTVFGHIDSGGSVINRILLVPLKGEKPSQRVLINRAYVVDDIDAYYKTHPIDPIDIMGQVQITQLEEQSDEGNQQQRTVQQLELNKLIAIFLAAIIMVSLFGVLLQNHIGKNRMLSLLMVNVLISGFALFIIMTPRTSGSTWLGFVLFIAIFGLFRLMSRFEKSS